MASTIMDVIRKYRGQTAEAAPDTGESYGAGGVGAVRQNTQLQAVQAAKINAVTKAAGENSYESTVLEEQRKQSNAQRDQQTTQLTQQARSEKQSYDLKASSILDNLESQMGKLSYAERMDQMEAAAVHLRLGDEKYRYELADVGRRQRLDNAQSFDLALQKSVFEEELELYQSNVEFQKLLTMDDASFRKAVADIDIDIALGMARSAAKEASTRAIWSAGGSVVTGAASGYVAEKAGKK